jgi:hypothetical protein
MRKQLIVAIFFLFVTALIYAQQEPRDTIRHKGHTSEKMKIKKELRLNKEQDQEMKGLHKDMKKKLTAIDKDSTLTPEQKKAQRGLLFKEQKEKRDSLLTPEQREKLKAFKEKRKEEKKEREHNR